MYVSMSRLAIAPERAPELVAAFVDRSRLADQADGFVDLQVWQSDRDAHDLRIASDVVSQAGLGDGGAAVAARLANAAEMLAGDDLHES